MPVKTVRAMLIPDDEVRYLSVSKAALLSGLSYWTVYRAVTASKTLPAFWRHGWRIREADFINWMEAVPATEEPSTSAIQPAVSVTVPIQTSVPQHRPVKSVAGANRLRQISRPRRRRARPQPE